MHHSNRQMGWGILGLAALLWLAGCATSGNPAGPHDDSDLRREVEQLYLNYHELKEVHSDLHQAAIRHMERGGGQLSEIQSAARFVDQANLIAYYQWELLSITPYIKDTARADFFTLRVRDVEDARQKSEDLTMAIKVYEAFLKDDEALTLIEKCIGHIRQNVSHYRALHELMQPLANPPMPPPAFGREAAL